jgi:hypothetical protein
MPFVAVFITQSSAELYDPRTGTFTSIGNMTTPRAYHRDTLLPDGRVLIVGGEIAPEANSPAIALASAELYDPGTGTSSATGDMTTPRAGPAATLLKNGKVLIAGGSGTSAELYNPSTGTFTATGDMNDISCDTATLLPDGTVLITRNLVEWPDRDEEALHRAEIYYPSTGTFAITGSPLYGHTGATATLLRNGKVLLVGGDFLDGDGASAIAELYDPSTFIFTRVGDMTVGREGATALPDGSVLLAGGDHYPSNVDVFASSAEIYDPVKQTFNGIGSMSRPRSGQTATLLKEGGVLIAGGTEVPNWWTTLASAEIYCPVNASCPPDSWLQAITAMKTAAGTDNLNFYQWAWYWQGNVPTFSGAPAGFGVAGSISPDLFGQITAAGGGDPLLNVSAEQWLSYFRQVVP